MANPVSQERFIVLQQAAEWYALLESGEAGEREHVKWQRWLAADPLHAATWRQVQEISGQFRSLPQAPARAALMTGAPQSRRAFAAMLVAAVGGLALWKFAPGMAAPDNVLAGTSAGYDSVVGQLRRLRLPDGGTLLLDTDSAIDIAYDTGARRIVLRRGRIHIDTAPDTQQPARPLLVQTGQGVLRALGTRFEVTLLDGRTRLRVEQGAVEITPHRNVARVVPAGAGAQFDTSTIDGETLPAHGADAANAAHAATRPGDYHWRGGSAPGTVPPAANAAPAWTRRLLLADNLPLGDFVRELSRYRRGYLGCAPEVAGLRLVGAYPLGDHEAVFAMLEDSLPVKVRHILPWWVTITAR
ncbi:FecR domain-containing protein [Duganella sp. FT27W]|uniref:FecR domain-containing protein n=1 Tax=Duganella sp. FT27W TaxID=2654636 RepID=UPI00186B7D44|nr:FecR domain-containing protein [Duganella sp. FT27W]